MSRVEATCCGQPFKVGPAAASPFDPQFVAVPNRRKGVTAVIQRINDRLLSFASHIDDNTIEQAKQTAAMPFVHPHVALMPDAHSGKGSAVGTVIPTIDAVIPAAVGVDIGCGMIAARTIYTANDLQGRPLAALRESIESAIPLSPGNYNRNLDRFPFTEARIELLQNLAWPGDDGEDLTHRNVDLSHSPKWREQVDGHIGLNATTPTPGAVSVCVYCRTLSLFTPFGTLRMPTDAEMDQLLGDTGVNAAIRVVAEYHRQHGAPTGGRNG